jgi:hypothetical protein
VLPASDFALGLKVGEAFAEGDMRPARKLGVTDAEVDDLGKAVLGALAKGPLSPDEIRAATGTKSRSLGEEGKKKGVTTTLPLALGRLQAAGEIRRVPVNGRLDQQRYQYARWTPNPLSRFGLSLEEAYTELARRFFQWIQPATVAEFQGFAGIGVKAAKAAVEPLGLVPLAGRPELLVLPDSAGEIAAFEAPSEPRYALVSSIDSALLARGDVTSLLDAPDRDRSGVGDKGERVGLGGLAYLPNHAILDRGRLVGLWEFDPEEGELVWTSFIERTSALEEAVARTEAYVKDDLGDARSFSLDSPKSRSPRIAGLRDAEARRV